MAITDAERHQLHTKLDEVLGEVHAAVLISHLPPSGWSDVVRTRDLDQLEDRMNARFEILEARFDAKLERLERELTNRIVVSVAAMFGIFGGLQALVAHLAG